MPASKYDFFIEQGTTFETTFTYKDANNQPIDLTDWCARLSWKTNSVTTQNVYGVISSNIIEVKDLSGIMVDSIIRAPNLLSTVSVVSINKETNQVTLSGSITLSPNTDIHFGGVAQNYNLSVGGINGIIALSFSSTTTNTFTFDNARYDLDLESDTGTVTRLLYGVATVNQRYSQTGTEDVCP